jgi:hypothetical protein
MIKLTDIKYYLLRSVLVFACFIISTAFINRSGENIFYADTTVSIVQENDGFTVSVKTTKNNNIRFYMFSVDGRLVKELNIYGSKRISITPLEKGIYIYDFFSDDKRLKNGKIELR